MIWGVSTKANSPPPGCHSLWRNKNKYNCIENQVIYLENLELITCIFTEV